MSVPQKHKEHAPASMKCGVITISDSRTPETDESGKLVRDLLLRSGHTVLFHAIVKDEAKQIVDAVEQASWTCDAIITNGGTGLAPRDVTIAALQPLFQKALPGFGELFRSLSYPEIGSSGMMSTRRSRCRSPTAPGWMATPSSRATRFPRGNLSP